MEDDLGDVDWDTIKFKLKLQPAKEESEANALEMYKLGKYFTLLSHLYAFLDNSVSYSEHRQKC